MIGRKFSLRRSDKHYHQALEQCKESTCSAVGLWINGQHPLVSAKAKLESAWDMSKLEISDYFYNELTGS